VALLALVGHEGFWKRLIKTADVTEIQHKVVQ
jgi:hypothetical protein